MSRRTVVSAAMRASTTATAATRSAATLKGAAAAPPAKDLTPLIDRAALYGKDGDALGKSAPRPVSPARVHTSTVTTPATWGRRREPTATPTAVAGKPAAAA